MSNDWGLRLIPILIHLHEHPEFITVLILRMSLVAHSEAYFIAYGRSCVIFGNWLSLGNSHATNAMDNNSHA